MRSSPRSSSRTSRFRPTAAGLPENLRLRNLDVLEEDLVELRIARDLDQGAHLDSGGFHVDQEVGQAVARIGLFAFAGDQHAPLRDVGKRGPAFLAVDDVVITPVLRSSLQTG